MKKISWRIYISSFKSKEKKKKLLNFFVFLCFELKALKKSVFCERVLFCSLGVRLKRVDCDRKIH